MSKLNFKFITNIYIKRMEEKKCTLEELTNKYKKHMELEKNKLEENINKLNKLQDENNMLIEKFKILKNILRKKGIILYAKNNNYEIEEWENLYLEKKGYIYLIKSKEGYVVKELDAESSYLIDKLLLESNNYRILVIRKDPNKIKMQMRIGI
ncbi:hypothetical protein ACFIJ5_04120 [Haloimpatiens sp. FM7330]|uniref:hypothetical protein n=1 Tax=Haloimpatiens sp. FM7330 TaxID=3298610 RepID=UPI00363A53CA